MSEHVVKILEANFITHDVKRFVVEKPKGYTFIPGQGTNVSINLPEWKDKLRPFTFTGLNKWEHLELIVKIYRDRNGVTNQLGKLNDGAELILHDVFGTINYKEPGVFIAGGTGITPFIAIFRELYKDKKLFSNKLIYSCRTSKDVIMNEELTTMLGENFIKVFTRENVIGFLDRQINRDFLIENIADFGQEFYVCGPESFVRNITSMLLELGAKPDALVIEK
jgi:hypothetical protein